MYIQRNRKIFEVNLISLVTKEVVFSSFYERLKSELGETTVE